MQYSKLAELCNNLTSKILPEGNEWTLIKYIHTPGQGAPAIDVQKCIANNTITAITDDTVGAGFIVEESQYSDISVPIKNKSNIFTFLDLDAIAEISFLTDDNVIDIYDIVNNIDNTIGYPIRIQFSANQVSKKDSAGIPIFEFDTVDDVLFKVMFSRNISTDEYNMKFYDKDGNRISGILSSGKYLVTVDAISPYIGHGECKIVVK